MTSVGLSVCNTLITLESLVEYIAQSPDIEVKLYFSEKTILSSHKLEILHKLLINSLNGSLGGLPAFTKEAKRKQMKLDDEIIVL